MRNKQSTLLAGVAALALLAGTAVASAEQGNQHQGSGAQSTGAGGPSASMQNSDKGSGSKGKLSGSMGSSGQNGSQGNTRHNAENGNNGNNGKMGASAQSGTKHNRKAENTNQGNNGRGRHNNASAELNNGQGNISNAQNQGEHNQGRTAQRNEHNRGFNGLQGNASKELNEKGSLHGRNGGANIKLSSSQRTEIRKTVIDSHGAPRVGNVDFDVRVGTVVPRDRIHVVPVPGTLVRIEPQWRGFLYFVFQDEVVIVNPRDMKIVAVVAV
jgi:hypothetical protein